MGYHYDPELAEVVPGLPHRDLTDLESTRAALTDRFATAPPVGTAGVAISEHVIPGDVRIRLYCPEAPAPRPHGAILHAHGGGFVMCDLESSHARNTQLVRELGVPLVSVDYRLAPEHPFPAALEDTYAALRWLADEAPALGADPARIVVHGVSAGAGLAAGVTLLSRDRGGPAPGFQFLNMPVLDDRQNTMSAMRFIDTPLWDAEKAAISWAAYLGAGVPGTADVSPYAAPARASNLSGLPPAYISVMEFDPLRDEGIAYAQALLAAGVNVELHLFPGTFHGSSTTAPDAAVAQREQAEEIAALATALAARSNGGP